METKNIVICIAAALLVSGCAFTKQARLYPANDLASDTGVLQATFIDNGSGNGTVSLLAPDGETFEGEYSTVQGGSTSFGSIFGSVYGAGGVVNASGSSTAFSFSNTMYGMASAFGTNGTAINCEFMANAYGGHGYGACETTKGALYRLNF